MRFLLCFALMLCSGLLVGCDSDYALRIDGVPRIAVVSAFPPEMEVLAGELEGAEVHSVNGIDFSVGTLRGHDVVLFLSGISVVNATMATQLALDRFNIQKIIFSGIAGGVDPGLKIGDVVIAQRWGQYLEMLFARNVGGQWQPPAQPEILGFRLVRFPDRPSNFGMMYPREIGVRSAGSAEEESRFWFPADRDMLHLARAVASDITLDRCVPDGSRCLDEEPRIIVGGSAGKTVSGVSGGAFIDNVEFREYAYNTFGAQVLDMESAAVAHVAYSNQVPFIAIRSLSDLAGGNDGENELPIFYSFAANNSAEVVKALLEAIPR